MGAPMTWLRDLAEALERRVGMNPRLVEAEPRLARLAERRTLDLSLPGPEAWTARVVSGDDAELDWLVERATIGFTFLGRDERPLEALAEHLAACGRRVRVWSAGCSTGEEVWTIARLLRERAVPADILGTDVHAGRLEAARAAGDGPDVRFLRHDLSRDAPPEGPWDAVVCRNVLMYFSDRAVAHATKGFRDVLRGGPLLLAPHEVPPDGWRLEGFGVLRAWCHAAVRGGRRPAGPDSRSVRAGRTPPPTIPPRVTAGPTAWSAVAEGNEALARHRFDDAVRAYALALERGLATAEVYALLGVLHRKRGDATAAEEAFRLALLHDDRFWPASWLLAALLAARGERVASVRLRDAALADARRWPASDLFRAPSSGGLLVPREDDHPLSRAARGASPPR